MGYSSAAASALDVFGTNTRIERVDLGTIEAGETLELEFELDCLLSRQEYTLTVATQYRNGLSQDWLDDVTDFQVIDTRDVAGVLNLNTRVRHHKLAARSQSCPDRRRPAMIYAIVLAIVVGTLCVVTIVKTRSVKNQADFLVAGRKLPWPVLVFTLLSSWIGAGSLFAGGENAYRNGFAALWQPAGGWVGLILIAVIAGRARRFAQFTVPDLLETRYNATARVMGTIAIVISYTVIASYQFKGGGA